MIKKYILLLLIFSSVQSMEKPTNIKNLAPAKKEILQDFEKRRDFLSKQPNANLIILMQHNLLRNLAYKYQLNNNGVLLDMIIADEATPDFLPFSKNSNSKPLIFLIDDRAYQRNREMGYSSTTLFTKLCNDHEFIKLYQGKDPEAKKLLNKKFDDFKNRILKACGVRFNSSNEGRFTLNLLNSNEHNERLHRPENYIGVKQLIIGISILELYQHMIGLTEEEMQNKLVALHTAQKEELSDLLKMD